MLNDDPLWYKDAIIYQTHVKSFYDSNGDGIGDFRGLTEKLDYIQDLGVTCIWVLPFYPSPLRDDGYDIADYKAINPAYGTMGDFRIFVREAHRRGLRVMTELVINHTSDQHPWFQRARRARPGSSARNFYVWSDTDKKYQGTRIIFTDTETSNWAWDPVAQAYYWHRFFSHQPDLNFDNRQVVRAVVNVMSFWLDAGVDGLRLDAVPYLIEREGTNNENLPESHAVIRRLRAAMDTRYRNRVFLAEANQWPEDVRPYFGDGDECHMAFHFPLMPRIFMAIAQEDRHPITDIMRQTPDIPETCQWAIFLRNHDELTLEMVTDRERDYMYKFYATDPRAKINVGIRRRLAPLMDNDRRRIELLNSLLMSMPGTPIIYYGDEIGMGDNIYLGDRDAVRTPMQWSSDRNGGFSRADPARLYLPANMDPLYGYGAVNVEAQQRTPSSLLNWMKRLIAVRQSRKVFGRGSLTFLYPGNRKILAYLREFEGDSVLCVANLSRAPQPVELNLSRFNGNVPVEMIGRSHFPPIGELPYLLTLPGHGFYWFSLSSEAEAPKWHEVTTPAMPELVTLVLSEGWKSLLAGSARRVFERDILPPFLGNQRWFAAKDAALEAVELASGVEFVHRNDSTLMALLRVILSDGRTQNYFLPLNVAWENLDNGSGPVVSNVLARVRRGPRTGDLYDALSDDRFILDLIDGIRREEERYSEGTRLRFWRTGAFDEVWSGIEASDQAPEVKRTGAEQSNTSVTIAEAMIVKGFRKVEPGVHPELEIGRFLTDVARYRNTPPLLGAVEHVDPEGVGTAIAVAQGFVRNQGDGWSYTLDYLNRVLEDAHLLPSDQTPETEAERHSLYLLRVRTLGQRVAELHQAFATPTDDPAFAPEPIVTADLARWRDAVRGMASMALDGLERRRGDLPEDIQAEANRLLARRDELMVHIDALIPDRLKAVKTRYHGDLHLGQVLVVQNDFYIIDFEGEPMRSLEERRAKQMPLRDVAGVLRSFDYAAAAAVNHLASDLALDRRTIEPWALAWEKQAAAAFIEGYRDAIQGCPSYPGDPAVAVRLLDLFLLEKALYEVTYELANRPAWVGIPLRGVVGLLDVLPEVS